MIGMGLNVKGRTIRKIQDSLFKVVSSIPKSRLAAEPGPDQRALNLVNQASLKAATYAGALSIPPGLAGLATVIPDLMVIWRIQSQLVADIASIYGKSRELTAEAMTYCLFRHAAAQAVRDLAVRVADRVIVREATAHVIKLALQKIGYRVSQRLIGKTAARWIPILGAVGVGAYAFFDTRSVGRTAIELFRNSPAEKAK